MVSTVANVEPCVTGAGTSATTTMFNGKLSDTCPGVE